MYLVSIYGLHTYIHMYIDRYSKVSSEEVLTRMKESGRTYSNTIPKRND